jgi:acyl carrier protein phosphodiesterase
MRLGDALAAYHPRRVNYLAHLLLSPPDDDALVGAMLGDFVKGPLGERYPGRVGAAIALHRRIDSFTDAHPVVRASRGRVAPGRRRYAGIMVDLFYDHFLARHWREHHDAPLEAFAERVYALLAARSGELPADLRWVAARMAERNWLVHYARPDYVGRALEGIGRRLKRGNGLLGSGDDLAAAYEGFEADFRVFFPEARRFAAASGA